jgi:hypothetical protein
MQMLGFALLLLGIGVALWVSLWLLVILFAVGLLAVVFSHTKHFLAEKGILNPTPGMPHEEIITPQVTVIEGDYQRVDSE